MNLHTKLGSAIRPGGFALTLLLAACMPQPAATTSAAAPPADPVMRAVAAASIATPISVASPAYPGPLTLTVTTDYISAEGQECRAYTLASAALPSQHLACTDGTTWREIPSLSPAGNPGFAP